MKNAKLCTMIVLKCYILIFVHIPCFGEDEIKGRTIFNFLNSNEGRYIVMLSCITADMLNCLWFLKKCIALEGNPVSPQRGIVMLKHICLG